MAFHGDYTPVLAKHSKHFMLADAIDISSAAEPEPNVLIRLP